jgi:hypothetical protein
MVSEASCPTARPRGSALPRRRHTPRARPLSRSLQRPKPTPQPDLEASGRDHQTLGRERDHERRDARAKRRRSPGVTRPRSLPPPRARRLRGPPPAAAPAAGRCVPPGTRAVGKEAGGQRRSALTQTPARAWLARVSVVADGREGARPDPRLGRQGSQLSWPSARHTPRVEPVLRAGLLVLCGWNGARRSFGRRHRGLWASNSDRAASDCDP